MRSEHLVHPGLFDFSCESLVANGLLSSPASLCRSEQPLCFSHRKNHKPIFIAHKHVARLHNLACDADRHVDAAWPRLEGAAV